MWNTLRTTALMTVLIVLFALVGGAIGGRGGLMIAFGVAVALNFGSYWFSDKVVLKMYDAQKVERHDAPELYDAVDQLRQNADLPMPRVFIIPNDQPNAFATGRNPKKAVVAVTRGLLNNLSQRELRGVLAHELAHVKNRDILTSSIASTVAAAIMLLSRFGLFFGGGDDDGGIVGTLLMVILAPIAAMLIKMAISRSREYAADRDGAEICRDPDALAGALESMQRTAKQRPMRANKATSHMFIVNPMSGTRARFKSLFSTHPATEERVQRLREMSV
jgi:heat shock protein HtpX